MSLWSGLDARRRLIAALAAGAAALAVWGLARVTSEPAMGLLYAGLDQRAIGGVVSSLEARGAPYEVRGDAVFVPEGRRDSLRMQLASEGQPQSGAAGYELLDGLSGFGTTSQMFDAAYWRAKEGELARTILALPRVRRARVHIANPSPRPFERGAEPSASVAVGVGSGAVSAEQAEAIRFLVSSAVAGLTTENVKVVDAENGVTLGEEDRPGAGPAAQDRAAALKANVERLLEARVGPAAAVVEVNVEQDMDSETVRERTVDPDSRVAIHTDTQESAENAQGAGAAGVTVASNLPDGDDEGGGEASSSREETRERVNYEVSEVMRERVRRPGDVRRISVAALVDGVRATGPDGATVWEPRPQAELEALEELVRSAVGFDAARGDEVTIRSMEFVQAPAAGTEASAGAGDFLAANAMTLVQLGVLSLVALILGLFVLRPMLIRRAEEAAMLEEAQAPAPGALEAPEDGLEQSLAAAGEMIDARGVAAERLESLREAVAERQADTASLLGGWLEDGEPEKEAT